MSSEVLTYTVTAGQTTVTGGGRIFNLLSAPGGPVSIAADTRSQAGGQSPQRIFNSIPAGSKFTAAAGERWTYLRITSAVTQIIQIFIGDEDMAFNNAVSITGTAVTTVQPAATLSASAAPSTVSTATSNNVPANPARRRITVIGAVANTATIYIQSVGANQALAGIPLGPGSFVEIDGTYSFDIRNDTGANQKYSLYEES